MNKQTIIGGVAGGVAFFFLGWIIFGMILMDFYMANGNQCANREEADFVWWAMIASNLAYGYFLALIFQWTNTSGFMNGAIKAGIMGLLLMGSFDLGMHAMTTWFIGKRLLVADILANGVFSALGGGIICWVMDKVKS